MMIGGDLLDFIGLFQHDAVLALNSFYVIIKINIAAPMILLDLSELWLLWKSKHNSGKIFGKKNP